MPLKIKITIILIALSIIYISLDASIQYFFIYPNFLNIEKKEAVSNINRCVEAIQSEMNHLDAYCHDWAAWDDTYEFVSTGSDEYIKSNLLLDTFVNSNIHLIHILNQNNQILWGKSYNLKNKKEVVIADFSPDQYNSGHPVLEYADRRLPYPQIKKNGIIITQTGPMLFATRPIMPSNHEGQIVGNIVMAKYIDKKMLERLQAQTRVDFTIQGYQYHEMNMLPEAVKTGLADKKFTIEIKNSTAWTLYHYLAGVVKGSGLLVQTHFPREITKKAITSIRFALVSLLFASVALLFITILVIHITMIKPIVNLTQHTKDIQENRAFLSDIEISRNDEIGVLGENFNLMLAKIRAQTDQLIAANLKLGKLSGLDGLTGIANRRRFDEKLQIEWKRCLREKGPLSLILCDIDYFKKYNDNLGHQTGDNCLQQVAGAIQKNIHRPSDLAARYGGEEFGIILFNTDSDGAAIVAERIRCSIEALCLSHPASEVSSILTISLGVSTMEADSDKSISDLLLLADQALYKAKKDGRNRFVIS